MDKLYSLIERVKPTVREGLMFAMGAIFASMSMDCQVLVFLVTAFLFVVLTAFYIGVSYGRNRNN